jgi:hypothetical protein
MKINEQSIASDTTPRTSDAEPSLLSSIGKRRKTPAGTSTLF